MEQRPRNVEGRSSRSRPLSWMLATLALMLAALAGWIRFQFGVVTFDQIFSNFPVINGQMVGNTNLFIKALSLCVILPIVAMRLAAMVMRDLRGAGTARPRSRWLRLGLPLLAVVVSFGALVTVARIPEYAAAVLANRTFAPYYASPTITTVPAKPKNLITIYLESIERIYSDETVIGQNLLTDLDRQTTEWVDYPGLEQDPGGGWTMAGLVGTQCGIPLKSKSLTSGLNANREGQETGFYLPGATCLGDLLADQGYTNAFVGGADGRFAGKATYLADHGYTIDQGLADWRAAGESDANITSWGLSDSRMLTHAGETVRQLRASGRPFNLTILTLDTHDPPGNFPQCTTDLNPMATAVTCSMRAVAAFLADLKAGGVLDDTVVILMGDHLKSIGDSAYYVVELSLATERRVFLRVWSPDPVTFSRDRADQLSVLATTLELLGFGLPQGRAGLGVSFASAHDLGGTALGLPNGEYRELVTSPSTELYRHFWTGA